MSWIFYYILGFLFGLIAGIGAILLHKKDGVITTEVDENTGKTAIVLKMKVRGDQLIKRQMVILDVDISREEQLL